MGKDNQALAFRISGRVQGVGFRYFVQRAAVALNLGGWVRNETDGSVLAHVVGPTEDVRRLREKLKQGPRFSRVDRVEETPLDADAKEAAGQSFTITY